jgi:hypothetical protein
LRVRHPPEWRRDLVADQLEDLAHQRLDHAEDRLGPRERHFHVHLRELGLPVGAQVLVAEALADLHVAVHPRDHEDLLEQLRRLRKRKELAGMHTARHEVVARAFRRGLGENRRLDLEEAVVVEVPAHDRRQPVTQDDVVLQPRATEIEIAVLEADVFRHRRLVGDGKRRRLGFVQHGKPADDNLDFAARQLRIDRLGRSPPNRPDHAHDELGPQPLGFVDERLVVHVEDDLRHAGAIADVDEEQPAQIAHAMHPAQKRRVCADMSEAQLAAGVRACQVSELLSHGASVPRESPRLPRPGRMCAASARSGSSP